MKVYDDHKIKFGENIRKQRLKLGLSQEALGHRMENMDKQSISEIELGKRNLTFENIIRLSEALEINQGKLMTYFL